MKYLYLILYYTIAAAAMLAVAACNGYQHKTVLDDVSEMIDRHETSRVRAVIDSLRQCRGFSESTADVYYLDLLELRSKDMYHGGAGLDSLRDIVSYYEDDGDRQLLPMAYFCIAEYCMSESDYPQAWTYLRKFMEQQQEDTPLKALAYQRMGMMYLAISMTAESQEAYSAAISIAEKDNDSILLADCYRGLAQCMLTQDNPQQADKYLSTAMSYEKHVSKDSRMMTITSLCRQHRYDEALAILRSDSSGIRQQHQQQLIAEIYYHTNEYDSLLSATDNIIQNSTSLLAVRRAYGLAAMAYMAKGDTKKARQLLHRHLDEEEGGQATAAAKDVARMQSYFYYGLRTQENQRLREQRLTIIICSTLIVIVLIALAGILAVRYYRTRMLALRYRRNMELAQHLQAEAESNAARMAERMQTDREFTDTDIYKRFAECANGEDSAAPTQKEWQEFMLLFAESNQRFTQEVCGLGDFSETEQRVIALIRLGFRPRQIAAMLCRTEQAVSNMRSRLYIKTFGEKGTPAKWDQFIKSL